MQRKKKICIVSDDLLGPIRNGGIGTACSTLGEVLARAGHEVTLLYSLGQFSEDYPIEHWVDWYRQMQIRFVPLLQGVASAKLDSPVYITRSYEVYQWLKPQDFDLIYFPEWRARGYYPILAKHQGLAFANTTLCVGIHSPTLWELNGSGDYLNQLEQLETDFMERQCVAWADAVISPSQYLLGWMHNHEWLLPENYLVRQNILPYSARKNQNRYGEIIKPTEIVFFGRLYTRKGIELFCDALDRLVDENETQEIQITFLGKPVAVAGVPSQEYIKKRSTRWPYQVQILTDYDQQAAIEYLQGVGRLAVIASLMENSPYTVLECLGANVPFLATQVGGIPELIHPQDRTRTCFESNAQSLSNRLSKTIREGIPIARPAIPFEETEKAWVEWVERLDPPHPTIREIHSSKSANQNPLVSVCLVHYNRPHYLIQALDSLTRLTYPNFEVVLVDDGSTKPEAIEYLNRLQPGFEKKGWRLIHQENLYLGAARNTAARHAWGEYLLFMDEDNLAKPQELDVFVQVALKTRADILTCVMDMFAGDQPPQKINPTRAFWIPLGADVAAGAFRNCFGDANALVRKDVFWKLGGFSEDYGIGHEDWEFFARATLQGYHLEVVPEPLYYYRKSPVGMLQSGNIYQNHQRNIRPYIEAIPSNLKQLVWFAQGQQILHDQLQARANYLENKILAPLQVEAYEEAQKLIDLLEFAFIQSLQPNSPQSTYTLIRQTLTQAYQIKDWKFKQRLLLLCSETLLRIGEFELATQSYEEATKIATALRENEVSRDVTKRMKLIQNKTKKFQGAQITFQKIIQADNIIEALEEYQTELSPELLDVIQRNVKQAETEGESELAEGLRNLAGVVSAWLPGQSAPAVWLSDSAITPGTGLFQCPR